MPVVSLFFQSVKTLVLFGALCCIGLPALGQKKNTPLAWVDLVVNTVDRFNGSLGKVAGTDASEFDALYEGEIGPLSPDCLFKPQTVFHADFNGGITNRGEQLRSPIFYFRLYSDYFTAQGEALPHRYLHWQISLEESTDPDRLALAEVRISTTLNGSADGIGDGEKFVLKLQLELIPGQTPEGPLACRILEVGQVDAFLDPAFEDEFGGRNLTKQLRAEHPDSTAFNIQRLSSIIQANNALYLDETERIIERIQAAYDAEDYPAAEVARLEAQALNSGYLMNDRKIFTDFRNRLDEWDQQIEGRVEALEMAALNAKAKQIEVARRTAEYGEIRESLLALRTLQLDYPEDDEIGELKAFWDERDRIAVRAKAYIDDYAKAGGVLDTVTSITSPLPEYWQSYFTGVYHSTKAESQRTKEKQNNLLGRAYAALNQSISTENKFIPSRNARITVNKALIELGIKNEEQHVEQILEDYKRMCRLSTHKVDHAREGVRYFRSRGLPEDAATIFESAWDTAMVNTNPEMVALGLDLVNMDIDLGRLKKGQTVLTEMEASLLQYDQLAEYWRTRLRLNLFAGDQAGVSETVALFQQFFSPQETERILDGLRTDFRETSKSLQENDRIGMAYAYFKPLALLGSDVSVLNELGGMAYEAGDYAFADSCFTEALKFDPDNRRTFMAVVRSRLASGNSDIDAARTREMANDASSSLEENYTYLKLLCRTDVKQAKAYLKTIKTNFPQRKTDHIYANYLFHKHGTKKPSKALKYLKKFTEKTFTGEAMFAYGAELLGWHPSNEMGFQIGAKAPLAEALKYINKGLATKKAPANPWLVHRYAGNIYLLQENGKKADAALTKAAEAEPMDVDSRLKLAVNAMYDDRYDKAVQYLDWADRSGLLQYIRKPEVAGMELMGMQVLIYIGADWMGKDDLEQSEQNISGLLRKVNRANPIHFGDPALFDMAELAYWVIVKDKSKEDASKRVARSLAANVPFSYLDAKRLDGTDVIKALSKDDVFKTAWKVYLKNTAK